MMRILEDILYMLVLEYSYSQILNCAMFFVVLTAVFFSFFLLLFLMQFHCTTWLMELHD